jgi:FSR family fosmidomycin resistance protein-like MFS transporter
MRLPANRLFWAVSLGHLINDMFMSMRAVVLTYISAFVLPMSAQQIGLAISAIELTGAFSQPFFGLRADKTGGRGLGAGGVAWTVSFMLIGMLLAMLTGNFWLMLGGMALAGLGSGAFHPVGSMHAAEVNTLQAGRNAALFFMCGQIGLALGPTLAGLLLNNAHTTLAETYPILTNPAFPPVIERGTVFPVFILAFLAVPIVLFMARTIPVRTALPARTVTAAASAPTVPLPIKALLLMGIAVAFRSVAHLSSVNFMAAMFQAKGWTPAEYGFLTGSFWLASGISGVFFGSLGDRYDPRRVILVSLLLTVPAVFLLPDLNGVVAVVAAMTIGAMSGSHSLIVVLAQRLIPGRKGLASGMILGFIFATGAISNLIVGSLIESSGATRTFQLIAAVTLLTSALWLFLPPVQLGMKASAPHKPAAQPQPSASD